MIEFIALAQQCAPTVDPQTMAAVVKVESSFNPYAIGVVGGRLERQPKNKDEAIATVKALEAGGWNFSVGVAQVNRYNLTKYNLTYEQAFEPCANLRAGSKILEACYSRALTRTDGDSQRALQAAISCYYSGNFTRGFKPDKAGQPSYVQKVLAQANVDAMPIPVVPNIANGVSRPQRDKAEVAAKPTNQATSDGLPVDNSPVLLHPGTAPAQLKTVVTEPAGAAGEPVANDESKAVPAGNGEQASSAIVF
jgi:type IV secretion system protein VirB1